MLCKAWFALALPGLAKLGPEVLLFPYEHSQQLHTMRVNPVTGAVSGHEALLQEPGGKVKQQWKAKGAHAGGWQREVGDPLFTDFLMFLVAMDASVACDISCLSTLVAQLSQVIAHAIEKYKVAPKFHTPSWSPIACSRPQS